MLRHSVPASTGLRLAAVLLGILACATSAFGADTDCIQKGGKAMCTGPVYGRPRMDTCVMNALSTTDAAEAYCAAAVPGPLYDEATVKARIQCLPEWHVAACHVDPINLNWAPLGAHRVDSNLCWDMIASDRLGWAVVNPTVKRRDQNNACTVDGGYYEVVVRRDTPVECPKGYSQRTLANGEIECWRMPTPCTRCDDPSRERQGNPIEIVSLKKIQSETDYRSAVPGGLEFTRVYHSLSYYRPPGATTTSPGKAFGDYWTHTYERRVYPISNSTYAAATVLRADGEIRYFGANGADVIAQGATDTLTAVAGGWRFANNSGVVEDYDSAGKLTTINDRGRVTTLTYSDANTPLSIAPGPGYLIRATDWTGRQLNFQYNPAGRLTTMVAPDGQLTTYELNGPSAIVTGTTVYDVPLVTKVTYPDSTSRTYHYNEQSRTGSYTLLHALTGITDEAGVRYASWNYESNGPAVRSELASGIQRVDISSGNPRQVTNALGHVTTYNYVQVNGVWRTATKLNPCVGGSCPGTETYSYNSTTGDLLSRTDPKGVVTSFTYDPTRRLETGRTEASGTPVARTITTQYHATLTLPLQTDEPGRRTTYTYDSHGNVETRTVTDLTTTPNTTRTWTYTYSASSQLLTENGPRTDATDVTTYAYYQCSTGYQCGQVHTITNALGHVTTYNTYNAHGQPLTITDPNGTVTTLTYDLRQRLTSRTVGTEQTLFEYWPTGLLKKTTLPDGSYLLYSYDPAHQLTSIEDAIGNRIVYTRDLMGNVTKEEAFDPASTLRNTRTQVFDALNRLQKVIGAAGTAAVTTTYGYDHNSNNTSVASPLARNQTQTFDALNRLSTTTDPLNGVTRYAYNALDQLLSVTDPRNLATTYTYNALGDLKQQVSPDTGQTTMTYDSAGNLKTSTDARNATLTYQYDALNRLTQRVDDQETVTFVYDQNRAGALTYVSDGSGRTDWTYTAQGRVASRAQTMGTLVKTVGYEYDTAGRLATITTPSGRAVQYAYTNGRVSGITVGNIPVLNQVTYEPSGATRGWTWGNGSTAVRTYDTDGRISQIASAGTRSYTYDDASRITGITDTANSALSWTYGYDKLDRLTSAARTSESLGFQYDANGNRLSLTGPVPTTYAISSTSNRLTAISGAIGGTYTYDEAGNTLANDNRSFVYSKSGRMISATRTGVTTTYAYNALGQRVKKSSATITTYFVYDEAGHLLGEYDANGDLVQETIWLGDTPVATMRWGECGLAAFYIHTDHLNTPRRITKRSSADIVWRWDSGPFGESEPDEDPAGLGTFVYHLRFPGQYYDQETGLHYNYRRDYDPMVGRYIESDPIGLDGGLNTYRYGASNPISLIDPLGLVEWEGTGTALSAIEGGGAIRFRFDLHTKCVNGKRAKVSVIAGGFALGAGFRYTGTSGNVTFKDENATPDPLVFGGQAKYFGGGFAPAGSGISCGWLRLGGAVTSGCAEVWGLDYSIYFGAGISTVTDWEIEECCGTP